MDLFNIPISTLPTPPHRQSMGGNEQLYRQTSNNWRDKVYEVWNGQMKPLVTWLNSLIPWLNTNVTEVKNARDRAENASNQAVSAKNEIESYVIPSGTTYSKEEADNIIEDVLYSIMLNTVITTNKGV